MTKVVLKFPAQKRSAPAQGLRLHVHALLDVAALQPSGGGHTSDATAVGAAPAPAAKPVPGPIAAAEHLTAAPCTPQLAAWPASAAPPT